MPAKKNNEFTPINDEKTVARYIRYIGDLNCPVHCAVRETDIRFDTMPVHVSDDSNIHLRMRNELISAEDLKKKVMATDSRKIDISFLAHDILIFAAANLRRIDKDGIHLEVDRPIYKLQRRQNLRVKPGGDLACKINLVHPRTQQTEEFKPYDVSISGFSIVMDEEEADQFPLQEKISGIRFQFGAREVTVSATIMNKVEIKGAKKSQRKIGFSIESIPTALEQEISRYAYLISQKILGRRI